MKEIEKSLQVQRLQLHEIEMQSSSIKKVVDELYQESNRQNSLIQNAETEMAELRALLNELESTDSLDTVQIDIPEQELLNKKELEFSASKLNILSSEAIGGRTWEEYFESVNRYIKNHQLSLADDPMKNLLTQQHQLDILNRIKDDYKFKTAKCDKYDYMIASFCGIVTGLIDAFLVRAPGSSVLGKWTDVQVDNVVTKFAKTVFRFDKANGANVRTEPSGIASAIGYLEKRFKVNYDARYASDLDLGGETLNMNPSNHHLKSLGHSPDIIGLFFSILDQFTGETSFISDGKFIRVEPEGKNKFRLQGNTLISRFYAGFANWLGHLMSDIAGSSGTRGHDNRRRGAGIPIPFYNLFQLCDLGSIKVKGDNKTIAEFSTKVFEAGYDARFGASMAIPVVINELLIKLMWSIKSLFYHKNSFKNSLPIGNKPELRRMLVVGHGALCLVDAGGAAIRSGGEALLFASRLNMVAWTRFGITAFKEARTIYLSKGIDFESLNKDLEHEWERVLKEAKEVNE
ncbi:hypothetical protein ACIQ57_07290 [Lysinibacillus xylanilyticus]|uniref:hypothetical protein n=1 Tax=Lysinibacillus xylanilyticus TaxID=582475 RepID=UPI00382EEC05